jgi:hypothetical protein
MESSGSSGFDMSKMSTSDKLLAGGGILLLIASLVLPWQEFCADLGDIGDLIGQDTLCAGSFTAWGGSGGFFGILMVLLTIALVAVVIASMAGAMSNVNMGTMSTDKLIGYLGLGVFAFGIIKFLFVLFNEVAWGAFIGLVLLVAVGWGAWQKVQESGGFEMGGSGGGSMGGDTPPPSAPPPSSPPPSEPPSGGMPPSSDL